MPGCRPVRCNPAHGRTRRHCRIAPTILRSAGQTVSNPNNSQAICCDDASHTPSEHCRRTPTETVFQHSLVQGLAQQPESVQAAPSRHEVHELIRASVPGNSAETVSSLELQTVSRPFASSAPAKSLRTAGPAIHPALPAIPPRGPPIRGAYHRKPPETPRTVGARRPWTKTPSSRRDRGLQKR